MSDLRDSNIKQSLESWMVRRSTGRKSTEIYDEYLVAMKRVHPTTDQLSPRARHRLKHDKKKDTRAERKQDAMQISTIASMVPDEIIYNHSEYGKRSYETALMFIDVSGFTDLCEWYTKSGRGGPSKLTHVLNSYIGAMVQEILTHNGDVLKFAGDAFLSMWKKTAMFTMQDVVHTAIDCGLAIQKNYGNYVTDFGITLKVKVAISAGVSHFAIIGCESQSSYVIVGQPVWDVKAAEYISTAGDVLTSASAWTYVNEAEYCTQPCGDGRHTKVLGVGVTWKRVDKIDYASNFIKFNSRSEGQDIPGLSGTSHALPSGINNNNYRGRSGDYEIPTEIADSSAETTYKEYSLRPAVISALCSSWWPSLRRFMLTPVLRAVDYDEPMDFLTEVRHVVVVFLNIITKTVTEDVLIDVVDFSYKQVCSVTVESGGLVNKVSMFDKDMMFLVVFGLRGLKHEDEVQKALLCAHQIKEKLQDEHILVASIGVTSGRTYCGVVGHVLRREYTVIGSSVNKAARLMMAYPDKVTCDKETFVRSKLDLDMFRLMEAKPLKGIQKPGPIYEFNKDGWPEGMMFIRHPILGRNEELRTYRRVLQNAIDHQHEDFTKYQDLRYGIIVLGPRLGGKKRLVDEFIDITPSRSRIVKIVMSKGEFLQFYFIRILLRKIYGDSYNSKVKTNLDHFEDIIRFSVSRMEMTPLQVFALNVIFNLRFPLPENFDYSGDLLSERSVRLLLQEIFNFRFQHLLVVAVYEGQYIDDMSWRVLIQVLEVKSIFIIITINDEDQLSNVAKSSIENNVFVKMYLRGIDRWYHAALACQLLDVQAIPADLEKVLESASGGLPGWIQNFVISLVQRGELTVVTVPEIEAIEAGAVIPSRAMLLRAEDEASRDVDIVSTNIMENTETEALSTENNKTIQMAVLAENYNFGDMKVDMTMDVIILKTYDSLNSFEKMLLKCGSVLGDVFSRRMLLHLLQSDSQRKVALAVAKLFEIRVLECEGGDFSRDISLVLVHPAPAPNPAAKPPCCACLGTTAPPNCRDLPMYSFCGYMKFRHSLFRTTTYELLTENQKQEMHGRALMYLERYTRRCTSCGSGCFIKLFGVRSNDGMIPESRNVRRVREQIAALSAETRIVSSNTQVRAGITTLKQDSGDLQDNHDTVYFKDTTDEADEMGNKYRDKRVRSFSSLQLDNCVCLPILFSVYNQVLDHCLVVGDCQKCFETYMEYVDLSLLTLNIPQALRLLTEIENIVTEYVSCNNELCKLDWIHDYRKGCVLTMRGWCMLESGDIGEARNHLLQAMTLFGCPFPTSKYGVMVQDMQASFQQYISLMLPNRQRSPGWVGQFYDEIAKTLNKLFILFTECKEVPKAVLAAKWSLKFTRKSHRNFRLLCIAYANMISIYRQKQNVSKCVKLEKLAMEVCHRKRGQLDVTEIYAVCKLYTSLFLFYGENGKKSESLQFGLSVIPMLSGQSNITVSQLLVLWMLKLLLSDLRIHEMVVIMREFFYMNDHYDLSSEAWYYYYAIVILLDTGYCVETYSACEKFFIKTGDAILRSRTPEAAWNFFVCMWLVTIRVGAWERSILWEDKINQTLKLQFQSTEFTLMLLLRLVEGFLISLVYEINNRNLKPILTLKKHILYIFERIKILGRDSVSMFRPRFLLLKAYYHYVCGKKSLALKKLSESQALSQQCGHHICLIWTEHTRKHWEGTLNPIDVDYWSDHIENDNYLDYRDFDHKHSIIVPYTLPLPKDISLFGH